MVVFGVRFFLFYAASRAEKKNPLPLIPPFRFCASRPAPEKGAALDKQPKRELNSTNANRQRKASKEKRGFKIDNLASSALRLVSPFFLYLLRFPTPERIYNPF